MKKNIIRFVLSLGVAFALGGCSSMSPSDTLIVNKANEYLRTGATRDPDEAIRMAREFYHGLERQAMEAPKTKP